MTTTLLQIDFPFEDPWGRSMSATLEELGDDLAREEGLVWKIWTENETEHRAGGIYLFADDASAERYRRKQVKRLASFGIHEVVARTFSVNETLSVLSRAPL